MAENNTILIGARTEPANNAPTGKVYVWIENGLLYTKDDNGTIRSSIAADFGKDYDLSVYEDKIISTSGTTWDTYTSRLIPSGSAGSYLVFGHASIRSSSTSNNIGMRLARNGSVLGQEAAVEFKDSGSNVRVPMTLIRPVTLADGETLSLDFATENTGATVTIYSGSLTMWRV